MLLMITMRSLHRFWNALSVGVFLHRIGHEYCYYDAEYYDDAYAVDDHHEVSVSVLEVLQILLMLAQLHHFLLQLLQVPLDGLLLYVQKGGELFQTHLQNVHLVRNLHRENENRESQLFSV